MPGRFHLLESGQLQLPAKCISCGSSQNNRKYIDLEIMVEFFGCIYFCEFCFSSTADDLEFVPKSAHYSLDAQLAKATAYIQGLEFQNEAIKRAMAAILATSFSFDGSSDDLVGRVVSGVQESLQSDLADPGIAKPREGSNASKRV